VNVKQITQNLKNGKMTLLDVPAPAPGKGMVMVRNHFSLISAGTEGGKVITARKNLLSKAREKPDQVKQVLDSVKTEGLASTYRKVMNKLDAPSPLGYSCAGEVIAVGSDISDLEVGDLVACGGATAVHAEIVSVPRNLCVTVPDGVSLEQAAYTTVAAIALQGVRQSGLRIGENCVVIGLGLLGQLTIQMLKASNIRAMGVDISSDAVELALESGADSAWIRDSVGLEEAALQLSDGFGVDAVIITAGSSSLDPVELAGQLCRKKGKVVVVGAVPTGFSRKHYYEKELDLRMSCSYGPGRYDADYEEKGIDYPIGFCRWTENRNMQAYLEMCDRLNIDLLTTHTYDLSDAISAFDMIVDKSEPFAGILIQYDVGTKLETKVLLQEPAFTGDQPRVGFLGAGSFAQKFLLPKASKQAAMIGVATANGNNARNVADKYGFAYATGNSDDILADDDINTIFIATRHNLHAGQVLAALQSGKNVFVEKPLCLTTDELEEIAEVYRQGSARLMVGFNRRFAPLLQKIKTALPDGIPVAMNYRINAGAIPADSWIQDTDIGGGRIIGEVCHFIDLVLFLAGSPIAQVDSRVMRTASGLNDTLVVALAFADGSVANISYFANGAKSLPKEQLEVHCAGQSWVLDDFKRLNTYSGSRRKSSTGGQDKGHAREVELFLNAVNDGSPTPISFDDIYQVTAATLAIAGKIQQEDVNSAASTSTHQDQTDATSGD
jgi:predicted dehydrogenase/threonine dehydrogenase-like Zn-dependent dehydrogenase